MRHAQWLVIPSLLEMDYLHGRKTNANQEVGKPVNCSCYADGCRPRALGEQLGRDEPWDRACRWQRKMMITPVCYYWRKIWLSNYDQKRGQMFSSRIPQAFSNISWEPAYKAKIKSKQLSMAANIQAHYHLW